MRRAVLGPAPDCWELPSWLEHHQRDAAHRVRASLRTFGGALLADAVGLGKTYVALAVATAYPSVVAVVPAILRPQWSRISVDLGIDVLTVTHESLSRGMPVPAASLIIVDEAHRLRNPLTKRYHQLARSIRRAHLLLVTATPVVNRAADLTHLFRLFAADNDFGLMGVSSLEGAARDREFLDLAFATAPAIVARSTISLETLTHCVPTVRDHAVIRASVVSESTLRLVLREIDALRFPTFGVAREAALLRSHLLHRLASSAAACRETVKRHLAYMRRALEAARRGETLSRALARRIFSSEDELQLELSDWTEHDYDKSVSTEAIGAEEKRLRTLLHSLSNSKEESPKASQLQRFLACRAGRKTIVFTTAVATALDIARRIRWSETAVVGSGRSWIATGPIRVSEALALFAPRATGALNPPDSRTVSTLIATDLVSEGLNLQDADAIVHYDLPWTPLRLAQRLGRVARLHSGHRDVGVWWFGASPELEGRLRLEQRIATKAGCQLDLGVVTTSRVGKARIINRAFEHREAIGRRAAGTHHCGSSYAVVAGPLAAAIVIVWEQRSRNIPELVVVAGTPTGQVRDFGTIHRLLNQLLSAPANNRPPPHALVDELTAIVRTRLGRSNRGPTNVNAVRLARTLVHHGYAAGKQRNAELLRVLDDALDRVQAGLPVGAERVLSELLHAGDPSVAALSAWLEDQRPVTLEFPGFHIAAAVFGDGSAP